MGTNATNQEILLMTTTLSGREFCEKNASCNSRASSAWDQLEEACWNGLLDELLPGIIGKTASGKKLFLKQVLQCRAFVEIELCDYPVHAENMHSVNPYLFLPALLYN